MLFFATCYAAYLDDGNIIVAPRRMVSNYVRSHEFRYDMISVFPTDIMYVPSYYHPAMRLNRLARYLFRIVDNLSHSVRVYRLQHFIDQTETRYMNVLLSTFKNSSNQFFNFKL